MRNKKLRKAVLTSFSIFAFTGTILASNLDNISKLQASLSSDASLDDGVETIDISPRNTPTTVVRNPASNSLIQTTYPFQTVGNIALLRDLVLISNTPSNFDIARDVQITSSAINNLGSTTNSGRATINVTISNYFNSSGAHIETSTPGYVPFASAILIENFRSVIGQTTYERSSLFNPSLHYASNIAIDSSDPQKVPISNVLEVKNGVSSISVNTIPEVISLDFDNFLGRLTVQYTLRNWIDQNGVFYSTSTPIRTVDIPGFRLVPGPTSLVLKKGINGNTLIPSTIAGRLKEDFSTYNSWFELINLPNNADPEPITNIKNISSSNKDGTISLTYTINGNYFDSNYTPQTASGLDFDVVISGLNSELEKVDILPFVIGGSVGGIVVIAIIVLFSLFLAKSKKKKRENLRKQKLSEKVSPPTGGVSKSVTPGPSTTSGPAVPGSPKPPVGPPTPGNRPVPPVVPKK